MKKARKSGRKVVRHKLSFRNILVSLFFGAIGILYLHNLTRDIYSGDIGDLVTASYVFGVAHPPGYPLFTFLGGILAHLPLPMPVVSRVALLSVFASLGALALYFRFSVKVTKNLFLSLLSTSILAFSYLFWLHAEIPEAFELNNLFAVAMLYLTYLFITLKMKSTCICWPWSVDFP